MRNLSDFIVASNFLDATDSLLSANRERALETFKTVLLGWTESGPIPENQVIFYHITFEDVADEGLRNRLRDIKTNLKLSQTDADTLDEGVAALITPNNRCINAIKMLLEQGFHDIDPICSTDR